LYPNFAMLYTAMLLLPLKIMSDNDSIID
jgi:hypothetical protein